MLIKYGSPMSAMSTLLENFLENNVFDAADRVLKAGNWPKVDIREEEKVYVITADMPGLSKDDVKISVEENTLKLEGEKKSEDPAEKGKYCHYERSYGKFSRSFVLPDTINLHEIGASMDQGVLKLTLPKTEKALHKKIDIKVS
jgi:HSP20 family protein